MTHHLRRKMIRRVAAHGLRIHSANFTAYGYSTDGSVMVESFLQLLPLAPLGHRGVDLSLLAFHLPELFALLNLLRLLEPIGQPHRRDVLQALVDEPGDALLHLDAEPDFRDVPLDLDIQGLLI